MAATDEAMEDDHEDGHSHDSEDALEWDADVAPPSLDVDVSGDSATGWVADVGDLAPFQFSDPSTTEHVPGQGHTHLFLDGELLGMFYEPVVELGDLSPGEHMVTVVLSRNDHLDYSVNGQKLTASTTFVVPGAVEAADVTAEATYADGEVTTETPRVEAAVGDTVELRLVSDVAEELHVHGYDLLVDLEPGVEVVLRFTADIPGIFEIELEGAGIEVFSLEVS